MALSVIAPETKEHLEKLAELMREEPWDPEDLNPENSRILVDKYGHVKGGIHFGIDNDGIGEIRFIRSIPKGDGGGGMLLEAALEELFKHVEAVRSSPKGMDPRLSRFFSGRGFKRGLGGKMVITKDRWKLQREKP